MVSILPNSEDKFYLQLLLEHRACTLSFDNLRTVDGIWHEGNKHACIALNLCDDDSKWINCLNKAMEFFHPKSIRNLFYNITLNCQPTDPSAIYYKFRDEMSADILQKRFSLLNLPTEDICEVLYIDLLFVLDNYLGDYGKSNADLKLGMLREYIVTCEHC